MQMDLAAEEATTMEMQHLATGEATLAQEDRVDDGRPAEGKEDVFAEVDEAVDADERVDHAAVGVC